MNGFISDFSILSALGTIKILQELSKSEDPEAKRLLMMLLKNSVIISKITTARGSYKTETK